MSFIYFCADAPDDRKFIAQHERVKNNLYVTCHGATADEARKKLDAILTLQGKGLKEKLEEIKNTPKLRMPL